MLEYKTVGLDAKAALDSLSGGTGQLIGYASVFHGVDAYNDTILPGAYADTIASFVERGTLHAEHDARIRLGTIASAAEDDHGLLIVADFHSTPEAQSVRTQILERLDRGKFAGLSIGYVAEDFEILPSGVRALKKIRLYEVSEVSVPADEQAGVIAAKSGDIELRAVWSSAFVNDLPDSSFALIMPGGTRDADGKTTPRSLRKLPHHDSSGALDAAHVRNGLARAPQMTGVSDAQRTRATSHLEKHLAAMNKAAEHEHEPMLRIGDELRRRRLARHGISLEAASS